MMKTTERIAAVLLLCSGASFALGVPTFKSYRGLGMGGAYVAVADDREALHLNPAGLALVSSKGTHPMLDDDRYWREPWELRWNFTGLDLPVTTGLELNRIQDRYRTALQTKNLDTIANHSKFFEEIWALDRTPVPINWHGEGQFTMPGFGFGGWGEIVPEFFIDHGALVPQIGIGLTSVQVIDVAVAQRFGDLSQLNLGIGYRVMALSTSKKEIGGYDLLDVQDTATAMARKVLRDITSPQQWAHGINLGVIWFQNSEVRWGAAAQNLGMKLKEGWVTPDLAVGVDWAPWIVQRNDRWARKVNFSAQYSDALGANYPITYMPLAHVDMGVEWHQTLWPKILTGRLSSGFHQGYPSFGFGGDLFRVLHLDGVTYSEEKGYFLGQSPERYYKIKFGMGF